MKEIRTKALLYIGTLTSWGIQTLAAYWVINLVGAPQDLIPWFSISSGVYHTIGALVAAKHHELTTISYIKDVAEESFYYGLAASTMTLVIMKAIEVTGLGSTFVLLISLSFFALQAPNKLK